MISKEAMEWMWLLLICIIILLITACVMLEYRSQRDSELASKACEHLQNVMYALQQAEIKTGVCCCGDSFDWNVFDITSTGNVFLSARY